MQPISFFRRALLTAVGAALLIWLISWGLSGGWLGAVTTAIFAMVAGVGVAWALNKHVVTQHHHFLAVIQDLQDALKAERPPLTLKSERADDTFGDLAEALNALAGAASAQSFGLQAHIRDLDQTKTLFESILSTMVEGVIVLDSQSNVLFFNAAAQRALNSGSRQVLGRPFWEVARNADLQTALDAAFKTGAHFRKEIELQRSRTVVELTAAPLPLKPTPGVVIVLHDVTELRRLEHMRREFVSNVSHELKTPLTSIQAYADTLLDGAMEDAEHAPLFLTRIIEQSHRLQCLIQDMLRLARIESQSEAFQLQSVPLGQVLTECVDARQAIAKSRSIDLALAPGDDAIAVFADASGLQTIADNLVSNAINYTQPGGRVDVRWFANDNKATIEVVDNGIGISDEHLDRIFERFFRVDKARSRGVGGTGLGLSIVKHLTSVFGGEIEVHSQVGLGSTFRVSLPLSREPAQPAPSSGLTSSGAPKG